MPQPHPAVPFWAPKDDTRSGGVDLGPLPEWNLTDLYTSPKGQDLARDFADAERRIAAFEVHRGQVAGLDSGAFGAGIAEYEGISETLGKIGSVCPALAVGGRSDPSAALFRNLERYRLAALCFRLEYRLRQESSH